MNDVMDFVIGKVKGGTSYGIHAERVPEPPQDVFYAWMEEWEDRVNDRSHVVEGTGAQALEGVVDLPDFQPIDSPDWRLHFSR